MVEILAFIAIVAVILAAGVLIYAATRPDTFHLARAVTIEAPPEKIFPLINDLRSFNRWNPFLKPDAVVKLAYSGPDSGKGAAHEWDGDRQVGKGRVEIAESSPSSKVAMKLDMIKPMEAHNRVEFTLEPKGDATLVTWAMSGPCAYIGKVMGVIFSMDKMCGREFEKGLADLKALAEN